MDTVHSSFYCLRIPGFDYQQNCTKAPLCSSMGLYAFNTGETRLLNYRQWLLLFLPLSVCHQLSFRNKIYSKYVLYRGAAIQLVTVVLSTVLYYYLFFAYCTVRTYLTPQSWPQTEHSAPVLKVHCDAPLVPYYLPQARPGTVSLPKAFRRAAYYHLLVLRTEPAFQKA